jgi:hypothetical protein
MSTMITTAAPNATTGCGCGCGGSCGSSCSCGSCACGTLAAFERPRFFSGQLLTEQELNGELTYVVDKNRLHNRLLHGYGVVCGLRVSCCDATHVTVEAGYALDPCGNDIVLPQSTTVDLLALIRDCRNRTQSGADCNPFLATQLTGCDGADQTWCLTISYAEQDARPVAALRSSASVPSAAATTAGCGCGCNGNVNGTANGTSSSTAVLDSVGRTATACEPTRTVETSTFGVACMPASAPTLSTNKSVLETAAERLATEAPAGTFVGDVLRCQADFVLVLRAMPDLGDVDPQEGYTVVCRWLAQVKATLAAHPTTRCGTVTTLAGIVVPAPPTDGDSETYVAQLVTIERDVEQLLVAAALECMCWNLIPSCPDATCDTCVVLACVTLRNDVIVDICLGWPRRQVITFPTLDYWMGGLASATDWASQLPTMLSPEAFGRAVSTLCCGEAAAGTVPNTPVASRLYAVADITSTPAPTEAVSGISQAEFTRLRSNVSTLRDAAVTLLRMNR